MTDCFVGRANARTLPLTPIDAKQFDGWLKSQPDATQGRVRGSEFCADPGTVLLLPGGKHGVAGALIGVTGDDDIWSWSAASAKLPAGRYRLAREPKARTATNLTLGWGLAAYQFNRYREDSFTHPQLVWPSKADRGAVERTVSATFLVRDLINTPAGDMAPPHLAAAAKALARRHKAKLSVTVGDQLLRRNYPAIHAVGRASQDAPRLIDLTWGRRGPKVVLVGKGVCFDSGGLNLKSAAGMKLMKKDMGGAAHVLGLASMIMAAKLPLSLRVLIPAVENAVAGNAFHPLDVLQTRKGLTVEVGNTDAEGRLVLCDALAEADRGSPDLIVDFATLTGAARIALGTDLPALFCNHDGVAEALLAHGRAQHDPLWRLPLHAPYRKHLDSKVADLNNVADAPQGGALVAALFLAEFVSPATPWAHFDVMAWNTVSRPGRPAGGEAMGMRAVYGLVEDLAAGRLETKP